MAIIALLSGTSSADIGAWVTGLATQGDTVVNLIGKPIQQPIDVALFLPTVPASSALALWQQGRSIITISGQPSNPNYPFVVSGGNGCWGCGSNTTAILANGASPLAQGWTSWAIVDGPQNFGQFLFFITQLASGSEVFGVYDVPAQQPAAVLYQPGGPNTHYWLWIGTSYSAATVPPNLLTAISSFVASQTIPTNQCGPTQACPVGQTCVNGVCLVTCGSGQVCPTGTVCTGGVCVPIGTSCAAGEVSIFGMCVPWWLLALLGVGAFYLLSGGGDGEKRRASPRRRLAHSRPRVITRTRTVVRHVRHRVTPHEASAVLHRRAEQLGEP